MGPLASVHLFSLSAAVSYGISDVCGALAARKIAAVWVTFWIQLAGLVVLVPVTVVLNDPVSLTALAYGGVAGIAGVIGLISYFRAMALSPIGIVSPIAAAVSVAVPVLVGVVYFAEYFSAIQAAGMLFGLAAVILAAYRPASVQVRQARRGLWLSVVAGLGFGLFYVALNQAPAESGLWPLLAGRVCASTVVGLALLRGRQGALGRIPLRLMLAAGILDALAQALFLGATRTGALGIAVLLTSLFPVVTVLAGRFLLQERLRCTQGVAVVLALAAIAAIVTG